MSMALQDINTLKKTTLLACVLMLLGALAAYAITRSTGFVIGLLAGGVLNIVLFSFTTFLGLRYWLQKVAKQEDASPAPMLLLSSGKIIVLGLCLFILVYTFQLDPLSLIFGVSFIYISLAFTPFFSKPTHAVTDEYGQEDLNNHNSD